ncbi:LysM domain-containing protein [uncultured Draconibacterium sp.]|uniref:LysM peptidoglycan-binding domain-containing protein n=1 Tax=uncultured Draconibacterium sp. TaxID=1573823 RepID=UPI00326124CD
MKQLLFIAVFFIFIVACSSTKNAADTETTIAKTPDYTSDTTVDVTTTANEVVEDEKTYEPIFHSVKKGESLWVIAQKYGVTVKAIVDANNIENPNLIKVGQELKIPEKE